MIWFLIVVGLLTVVVLAGLLGPMMRPRPGHEDEEPIAALFRRQLAGLDQELAEGRLTAEEAEASRTEITRRLLAMADREPEQTAVQARRGSEMSWRFGAVVAIAGLLPAAAMAVYFLFGTPAAIEQTAGGSAGDDPHTTAELSSAVDQIKAHLQKVPDDLKGWTLLGRTLASLGRFPEARNAYTHAITLAPDNASLHAEYGEVLVLAAQGTVTPAAAAEFSKAPDDPRSRYYAAEAALQQGDPVAARQKFRALLASAPADAPWRQTVADRLAELSPNDAAMLSVPSAPASAASAAAAASATTPGPTAQDVAAAQSMTPEQRQDMIRGMVERLAQRLEQHPDDRAGWERLARAYDVLGEPDKAQSARAHAAAATGTPAVATANTAASVAAGPPMASPSNVQGWIERARSLQGEGRAGDALAALKQANTAFPANLPLLEAYLNALADGLKDDKLTPEFIAVVSQINALDAHQPDALWYLGLAAVQNGDRFRAASYWTKLVAELPPDDPQRALVQHRLDALR